MKKKKKSLLGQLGQTSVEYILLIAVVAFCATSVFKKLEEYIVSNPDSFLNSYLSAYKSSFGGTEGGFRGAYKHFTIKR